MKTFYLCHKGLHRWLLVNAAVLLLFFLLCGHRAVMNALAARVTLPFERAMAALCALVPFSVAELCYVLLVIGAAVFLVRSFLRIRRAEHKGQAAYRRALTLVNVALSIYAAFCLLWGTNYYIDDFCDRSGIKPAPVAYEDLVRVTRYFADGVSACAEDVPRNADGTFAVPREDILACATEIYGPLYDEFPFLCIPEHAPKPMFFSRFMSAMNFTGFYFPYTGEANLNMDFPAATLPATVAHELAHRRGIASEQQCNFISILACTRSDNAAYRYAGWLSGYIHLSNALYRVNPELWREIRAGLPESVQADLHAANEYWAQFEGAPAKVSNKVYDGMLKSYGDTLGMQSYGAVVDLLVVYYLPQTYCKI